VTIAWRRRQERRQERNRRLEGLMELARGLYGSDRLVFKAAKLGCLRELRSEDDRLRALALGRLVLDEPTLSLAAMGPMDAFLDRLEEALAEQLARRNVEDRLERRVAEKMQERHEAYLREIRHQVLAEDAGPENATTLRRLAQLEKWKTIRLSRELLGRLRPTSLDQVVGQERAVAAVLAKVASPFPQHILLYGPPGTGKTTVARLALEVAKASPHSPFGPEAPFVEVDGATLRWDPRDVANPLLGSVHDPIYQGARRDLAEGGIPEPKLGLVTEAHGGILFIDEIGEMDPLLQAKLLKVLEDKRVTFDSSYYDPNDPQVPQYIRQLFEEGAPADFLLIGATTRDPEEISPALRSRCAEIYFDPLSPQDIARIVSEAAMRVGLVLENGVAERIAAYTEEGRKAIGLLADAYAYALQVAEPQDAVVTLKDVDRALQAARLGPLRPVQASREAAVGRVLGMAVSGHSGVLLELEAAVFAAKDGRGTVRFNESAGSMARDSVFNAASVIRRLTGQDLSSYDVHVNVVGGGRVDGPSAGVAVLVALYSALTERPVRGDVAVTGEISLRGLVRPVGGIYEKVVGAHRAGVKKVIVPRANEGEVPSLPGLEVVAVQTAEELLDHVLMDSPSSPSTAGEV
jgi:ATP-dependent Lon protease